MGHCVRLLRAHNRLFDTAVSAFSGYLGLFGIVKISQNPPNFPASNPDAESRKFLKDLEASEKVRNILKLDSRLPRSSKVQGFSKYRVLNRFALTLKTHAQVRPSLTKKRQERSLLIPVQSFQRPGSNREFLAKPSEGVRSSRSGASSIDVRELRSGISAKKDTRMDG